MAYISCSADRTHFARTNISQFSSKKIPLQDYSLSNLPRDTDQRVSNLSDWCSGETQILLNIICKLKGILPMWPSLEKEIQMQQSVKEINWPNFPLRKKRPKWACAIFSFVLLNTKNMKSSQFFSLKKNT